MPRRKRKTSYWIDNIDPDKWWSIKLNKWVESPVTNETGDLSTHRCINTFRKAIQVSCTLPKGTTITRITYNKGRRWFIDFEW